MNDTFIVDYGHHSVKSGRVANKGKLVRGTAKQKQQQQSVIGVAPSAGCDPATGQLDTSAMVKQIAGLMSTADAAPAETTLAVLTAVDAPRRLKEKLIYEVFESLSAHSMYLGYSPVSALFSTGVTSGTVVDVGHYTSRVVPVHEGIPVREGIVTSRVAGFAQSTHLQKLLTQHGVPNLDSNTLHMAKSLKGRTTTASMEAGASELPLVLSLPDNQVVRVPLSASDYCQLGNVLFQPREGCYGGAYSHELGLQEMVAYAMRTVRPTHPHVCNDWVMFGGPSQMGGAIDRLKETLSQAPSCLPAVVVDGSGYSAPLAPQHRAVADRNNAAWLGASLLSQLSSFSTCKVTKAMYGEEGPHRVMATFHADRV